MKIAFVGKGGSGKTTISRLFIEHLAAKGERVFVLDADINIHLSRKYGVQPVHQDALSHEEKKKRIRDYLVGSNVRIGSAHKMVKTTPPGPGSRFISIQANDPFIKEHTRKVGETVFLSYVGTYEADEIGTSCYHTNLSIAENVISHTVTGPNEWLVADMVAGTDAFSCTLHMQFDAIVLVVEPTPDGVSVALRYKQLATAAGTEKHLLFVGNKCMDEADAAYLRSSLGDALVACCMQDSSLRRLEQAGGVCTFEAFNQKQLFSRIEEKARALVWDRQEQLQALYALHEKYCMQSYILSDIGDVRGQIDPDFVFPSR